MKPANLLTTFFCIVVWQFSATAQEKSGIKFGKITPQDFEQKIYPVDSSAAAVILADIGSTRFAGNSNGWFSLEFKHYRRVHILNKNGYDIANVSIPLYKSGNLEEEVRNLRVVTYNLENGKVTESQLEKSGIFKEKVTRNVTVQKFTFPNIKEGSIIEYEYVLRSDFLFNLQPWEFQGSYPRLWSEYTVTMPVFFAYMHLVQGYVPFHIKEEKNSRDNFAIYESNGASASETYRFSANVTEYRWVTKNVPALKEESYTSSINNHISKISFQLAEFREPLKPRNVMGTWGMAMQDLLKDEDFGASLASASNWMGEYVNPLLEGASSELEKARRIYQFVSTRFTCTSHHGIYLTRSLKAIAGSKNGTVAELNLLLTAMLRYAGLQADPVLLSTRSNGSVYPFYPMIGKFNYVVCRVVAGEKLYDLDASRPLLGFGRLLPDCYNGHARLVTLTADAVNFDPGTQVEASSTIVRVFFDSTARMEGQYQQSMGHNQSYKLRKQVKEGGRESYLQQVRKIYGEESMVSGLEMDSLDRLEDNVLVKYNFTAKGNSEDVIYFNPLMGEAWKENPFKAANRFYPVEMPFTINETYSASIMVPDNYVVEEIPKPVKVQFQQAKDGFFEYMISHSSGVISLRSRIVINRAFFEPGEYEFLRELFSYVIKKQAEQIVLKKKS
ncbi:MAG TPA: transglutaminase domain-containing protein [Lacibacter sp.]|nr:transglutaminase domain-containing protein [Lacibacter sp.]HMO89395.1 transglutaminase domain-containing protein [Lacibacter sp.]HMP87160.1 transglutaminase domain-containing protein [Lacibacter sp.]